MGLLQRLLHGDEGTDAADAAALELDSTELSLDVRLARYIRSNFQSKHCEKFVSLGPNDAAAVSVVRGRCYCGGEKSEHKDSPHLASPDEQKWSELFIKFNKTNAFGSISFQLPDEWFRKPVEYIRLSDDADMACVRELMSSPEYWNMLQPDPPDLVVSVLGSSSLIHLSEVKQKEIFRSLLKAVKSTRGWIITSGFYVGVSKAVGDAVLEAQVLEWQYENSIKRSIKCIGVGPWGAVKHRNLLENPDPEVLHEAQYPITITGRPTKYNKPILLDPNHSRFFLVDDGRRNRQAGASVFRANLEKMISRPKHEGGLGIPVVCLLMQGGDMSLESAAESVKRGIPLIICEGTGKAADLLVSALNMYKQMQDHSDEEVRKQKLEDIKHMAQRHIKLWKIPVHAGFSKEQQEAKLVEDVLTCCQNSALVYQFNVKHSEDLDLTILSCLLEQQGDNETLQFRDQLTFAQKWNRVDMAQRKILDTNMNWEPTQLHEHFTEALINNQIDFVRLYVESGVNVQQYLKVEQLRTLYQRTLTPYSHLFHVLQPVIGIGRRGVHLCDIYTVIKRYTRRFSQAQYKNDKPNVNLTDLNLETFAFPYQELFIWSVLLNRKELANFFWEQCELPLVAALVGSLLSGMLANAEPDFKESYVEAKVFFETLAVNLINQAFENSTEKAVELVEKPEQRWEGLNAMALAGLAEDRAFLATTCCQQAIFRKWKSGFEANGFAIVFSTFFVLPLFHFIRFLPDPEPTICSTCNRPLELCRCGRAPVTMTDASLAPPPASPKYSFNENRRASMVVRQASALSAGPTGNLAGWKKLYRFYSAPVTKFTLAVASYAGFLVLYAYVILFSFRYNITYPEIALHAWICTMVLDELRLILSYPGGTLLLKLKDWWSFGPGAWYNRGTVVTFVVAAVAFALRWCPYAFAAARVILAVNFVLYMQRLFNVYFVNNYLGPKVIMIRRMSWDLLMFLLVLVVFMVSYSVASQSLLHPRRDFYPGIVWDLFNHGIWEIFGQLDDESTEGALPQCDLAYNVSSTSSTLDCSTAVWPVPILLAIYLFFGNILLINMLIAIFAYVFDEIQANAEQIWKFQMYFLVNEYAQKPLLPSPFNVISLFIRVFCYKCSRAYRNKAKSAKQEAELLSMFERSARADYLHKKRHDGTNNVENALSQMQEQITTLTEKVVDLERRVRQTRPNMLRGFYAADGPLSDYYADSPPVSEPVSRKLSTHSLLQSPIHHNAASAPTFRFSSDHLDASHFSHL